MTAGSIAVDVGVGFLMWPTLVRLYVFYWSVKFREWWRSGELQTSAPCFLLAFLWPVPIVLTAALILGILFVIRVFEVRVDPLNLRRFASGMAIVAYWLWLNSIPWNDLVQIVAELAATIFLLLGGPAALGRQKRDDAK